VAVSEESSRGKSNYITPEGYSRLRAEHHELWKIERPRVTNQVSVAAALGDRSENADYIYGKKRLREIDRRIRFLEKRMETLQVVEADSSRDGERVFFGAWVTLEEESGDRVRYRVVGPDESDPANGLISMDSPVGRSLLGKSVGDEVTVRRPKGGISYEIVAVAYAPEEPSSR
jgi:transcription elongation factor GreB